MAQNSPARTQEPRPIDFSSKLFPSVPNPEIYGASSTSRKRVQSHGHTEWNSGENGSEGCGDGTSCASTTTTKARRTACDVCRERKVRCNGERPGCQRCRRLGHQCSYTVVKRQDITRSEVSQALMTLQVRLGRFHPGKWSIGLRAENR